MNILVTGSKGQLGNEIRRLIETGTAEIGSIPAEYQTAHVDYVDYDALDITDTDAVNAWFNNHTYDVVINCAAMTNVDGCETNIEDAFKVNAQGPENLAKACQTQNAKFIQVSTDYVFPGTNPVPRCEEDTTGPISAYGKSKLAGEEAVQKACKNFFIVRTAWLYGYVGKNFVKTMLNLGKTKEEIFVVDDQMGNPTSANDLAYEILKLALTENYGIYHCTNEGTCSWADFSTAIMKGAGLTCKVNRCTSKEYKEMNPQSADRPAYSSLENKHLKATIGNEMRNWQDALSTYLEKLPELEG
jgi:dTDP-4-dehydrorhamnose reductase